MKLVFAIVIVTLTLRCLHSHPAVASDESLSKSELDLLEAVDREDKLFTGQIEAIVRNTLPHIPTSRAYDVHREKLSQFLQATDDLRAKSGDWLAKEFNYSRQFNNFMETYSDSGVKASPEHKEMLKLLNEHGLREFKLALMKYRTTLN